MNENVKAYNQKVRAELQQAKSKLDELAARSKAEDKQAATDLINQLKSTHHSIEKKIEEVNTSAAEEIQEEQAEINAGISKLKEGLVSLDRKLTTEPRAKAG
jgi:hypothetical protein